MIVFILLIIKRILLICSDVPGTTTINTNTVVENMLGEFLYTKYTIQLLSQTQGSLLK